MKEGKGLCRVLEVIIVKLWFDIGRRVSFVDRLVSEQGTIFNP
jgi:hypothetical protein